MHFPSKTSLSTVITTTHEELPTPSLTLTNNKLNKEWLSSLPSDDTKKCCTAQHKCQMKNLHEGFIADISLPSWQLKP